MPTLVSDSVYPASSDSSSTSAVSTSAETLKSSVPKPPRPVLEGLLPPIFAFPPNRDTLGSTAYLIVENQANILIDCPAWEPANQQFLQEQGGVAWLLITHRGGIGKVRELQQALGCQIVIQEQEAYLLPGLAVQTFQSSFRFSSESQALWTPGHSPGSSCLYHGLHGGMLFTGRHLLPNQQGDPAPLRTSKTFHWPRQIRSTERLLEQFTAETLAWICPGANTGFLRGKRAIAQAYPRLAQLDLTACLQSEPIL